MINNEVWNDIGGSKHRYGEDIYCWYIVECTYSTPRCYTHENYVDALWLNKDYICYILLFEDTAFQATEKLSKTRQWFLEDWKILPRLD